MNAEKILDAMQYLPEELLLQTDRLRQRKTVRWQHLAAMAACLCLVLGLAMGLERATEKSTCDNGSAENLLGITLTDKKMMVPTKSITAVIGCK